MAGVPRGGTSSPVPTTKGVCWECQTRVRSGRMGVMSEKARPCCHCQNVFCKLHVTALCKGCYTDGWLKPKEQAARNAEEVGSLRMQLAAHTSEKTAVEQQVQGLERLMKVMREELDKAKKDLAAKSQQLLVEKAKSVELGKLAMDPRSAQEESRREAERAAALASAQESAAEWKERALKAEKALTLAESKLAQKAHEALFEEDRLNVRLEEAEKQLRTRSSALAATSVQFATLRTTLKEAYRVSHCRCPGMNSVWNLVITPEERRPDESDMEEAEAEVEETPRFQDTGEVTDRAAADDGDAPKVALPSSQGIIPLLIKQMELSENHTDRTLAVDSIMILSEDPSNRPTVIECGGLEVLAMMVLGMKFGATGQQSAAHAISKLAQDAEQVDQTGGVMGLVHKMKVGSPWERDSAAHALACLAVLGRKENRDVITQTGMTVDMLEQAHRLAQWMKQTREENQALPLYIPQSNAAAHDPRAVPSDAALVNDCLMFWQNCKRTLLKVAFRSAAPPMGALRGGSGGGGVGGGGSGGGGEYANGGELEY